MKSAKRKPTQPHDRCDSSTLEDKQAPVVLEVFMRSKTLLVRMVEDIRPSIVGT